MRLIVALVCLFILAPLAHATDVTVTCVAPTTNTDGTPIAGAITFNLYNALKGATKVFKQSQPTCSFLEPSVAAGNQCYAVSATVGVVDSGMTVEACTTITGTPPALKPNKPGAPNVKQSVTAPTVFSVLKAVDSLVLIPIGTVPNGTTCDTSQGVIRDGVFYGRVETSAITFTGTARPLVSFGVCS